MTINVYQRSALNRLEARNAPNFIKMRHPDFQYITDYFNIDNKKLNVSYDLDRLFITLSNKWIRLCKVNRKSSQDYYERTSGPITTEIGYKGKLIEPFDFLSVLHFIAPRLKRGV